MIEITDKSECCGCWACSNVCPTHCIEMQADDEGFHYPIVDKEKCIDCGLCEKVCPILKTKLGNEKPQSFVIQHKDADIRRHSTSGGFFTAISYWAIEKGGVVFGAAFDADMTLRHSYSETLEGCAKFRGSKYVQSLIGETYMQAKDFLNQGRWVVFSGTPCQIAGLHGFLRRKYEKLVTVDLVCHGTPSPRLLSRYLAYHESVVGSRSVSYLSRDKHYGYDYSTATIEFEDKDKTYHRGKDSDMMLRFYFANLCSRPSCYHCHFKTLERCSDFTIFDCWDAPSVSPIFDRSGATNLFIHTPNGKNIFEALKKNLKVAESEINSIIERDGVMIFNHVPENPRRKDFFHDLNTMPIESVEKKYLDCSALKKLLSVIKPFMYKFGVFSMYMRLKNWK